MARIQQPGAARRAGRANPAPERIKFLAIVTSNLDELFMKRVGAVRDKAQMEDREYPSPHDGDARMRLIGLREFIVRMLQAQAECYATLVGELRFAGMVLASWGDLTPAQRDEVRAYFDTHVSPTLTPLAFDSTHPFPFMSNQSTSWAFVIRSEDSPETQIVRVKIPPELPAWLNLKVDVIAGERRYVSLEEVICRNARKLFPGRNIASSTLFRILRNAQVEFDEDENDSLREAVTDAIRQRRFEPVVGVDCAPKPDPIVRRAGGTLRPRRSRHVRASEDAGLSGSLPESRRSTWPHCLTCLGRRSRSPVCCRRAATSSAPSTPATSWSITLREFRRERGQNSSIVQR